MELDQNTGDLPDRRLQWMAVVAAGDAGAYGDLVTEGVVWVPPDGEAILGRRAFRAWVRPFFRDFTYEFTVRPSHVAVVKDWAVECGEFVSSVSSSDRGRPPIAHSGAYVVVWALGADHLWRIDRYFDVTASRKAGSVPGSRR